MTPQTCPACGISLQGKPIGAEHEVPVVPCDDTAIERATREAREVLIAATDIIPVGDEPYVGWSLVLAERLVAAVLRAAGETT